jgi:hypothetical protein
MRKTLVFGVKPVGELGTGRGFGRVVVPSVEFTAAGVVEKVAGFCALIAVVFRVVIHRLGLVFISVGFLVLPNFHNTYYKLLLIK